MRRVGGWGGGEHCEKIQSLTQLPVTPEGFQDMGGGDDEAPAVKLKSLPILDHLILGRFCPRNWILKCADLHLFSNANAHSKKHKNSRTLDQNHKKLNKSWLVNIEEF